MIISIKGQQSGAGANEEPIELVTAGKLEPLGGKCYTLSYQESEVTGFVGTLTTIQVEPSRVTLQRIGAVNSQMVFEEGRRHLSMYDTPYGALSVGIHTRKLRSTLDDNGGRGRGPLRLGDRARSGGTERVPHQRPPGGPAITGKS